MRQPIRAEPPPVTPAVGPRRHRVAFFLGCMMNVAMPDVSRATVRVLARAGCDVVTPCGQACCGAPQDDQAMLDLSRYMARRNIALFEPLLDEVEAIVTDCAGCRRGVEGIRRVASRDPAWAGHAQAFSAKVRDVTEWLDTVWPEDLPLRHSSIPATYHDPCHLANLQNVRSQPRRLRRQIQGLECGRCPTATRCGAAAVRASTT